MPNEEIVDDLKKDETPGETIPEAAKAILDEVRKQSEEKKDPPPSSQPKQDVAAWVAQREDFKKKMNFNEEQMQLHERDRANAQAPVLLELSKMKVREGHKDFDQLKAPFEAEVANYVARGVIVNPELADQIFLMVKGKELEAGRWSPPSSQPADKKPAGAPANAGGRASRIAAGYSGSEAGLGGGVGGSGGGAGGGEGEAQISDREKEYAKAMNVDPKDYKKMKEEKQAGIREIGERAIRPPEIDMKTAGPADRDLAALWGKNGGRI